MKKFVIASLNIFFVLLSTPSWTSSMEMEEENMQTIRRKQILQRNQDRFFDAAIAKVDKMNRTIEQILAHLKTTLNKVANQFNEPGEENRWFRVVSGDTLMAHERVRDYQAKTLQILKQLHERLKVCRSGESRRQIAPLIQRIDTITNSEIEKLNDTLTKSQLQKTENGN